MILGLIAALVGLMFLGWQRRRRRQSGLEGLAAIPDQLSAALLVVEGWYVATTYANQPLERIAVGGLGFRSRATVAVHPEGIVLDRRGSEPAHIPAADLRSTGRATWAIDRVVERDGLVVMGWMLGSTPVDSYFRLPNPTDATQLVSAVTTLLPATDTIEEVSS
jgi:hypothetical protein